MLYEARFNQYAILNKHSSHHTFGHALAVLLPFFNYLRRPATELGAVESVRRQMRQELLTGSRAVKIGLLTSVRITRRTRPALFRHARNVFGGYRQAQVLASAH